MKFIIVAKKNKMISLRFYDFIVKNQIKSYGINKTSSLFTLQNIHALYICKEFKNKIQNDILDKYFNDTKKSSIYYTM